MQVIFSLSVATFFIICYILSNLEAYDKWNKLHKVEDKFIVIQCNVDKMNLERTLLIYDSVKYFVPYIREKGVKCFSSFRTVNELEKVFRKISFNTGLYKKEWYGEWKNHLNSMETVIVFATNRYDFIEYIADNWPQIRIIVWYWNPVFRCFNPSELKRKNIEYWSFDKNDCAKYKLNYNTTFYFDSIFVNSEDVEHDVLFLGADKGRRAALLELKIKLTDTSISTHFHIVSDENSAESNRIKPIGYNEYLSLIGSSKCIVDYIQKGQAGLTLRPMESIFLRRKLITNDINILNEDFYKSDNVFIVGHDNFDRMADFIDLPFKDNNHEIIKKYDFLSWLNRFNINE